MLKIGATTRLADIAANPVSQSEIHGPGTGGFARRDSSRPGHGDHRRQHRAAAPLLVFPQTGKSLPLHPQRREAMLRHDGRQSLSLDFRTRQRCIAVHPSDIAPALIALNAKIVTNTRTIAAENFFDVKFPGNTVLAARRNHHRDPDSDASGGREERVYQVRNPQVDRFPDRELRRDGGRRRTAHCFECGCSQTLPGDQG